ncbi:MFS transporter [Curtobacterium pusillum]|uniref:EmrB/QacA subfamily drug resistance transporter n=1 Tax=Curtobacterium pusillum TaxID=69373 RepID=A0AAW3T8Z6_9MICO|nr:MFS transporter [Curtobacterium pusillum]MBA8991558.1 EmrB/QacA subfamily drug resistance transporter [Curtobacterium pusillum]NUU13750.1 MFS transporter [Curtobacterium pusillum]GLK30668.1 MFS transporter [Curtobacterium pusillum]
MSENLAPSAPPADPRRWLTLGVVGLAQLMVVLDATVVNIALPSAQSELGFSDADRQWIITAYSLAFGSLLLLGGRLSDLLGRKTMFVIGVIGFAAASALGGAAGSFGLLVTARALQGAFGALLAPTALAVLTTTFTNPKEKAQAFGVFGAIAGAGGAIGLLLGGVLTQTLDWRWNLYINDVIAVFALLGAFVFVRRAPRSADRARLDLVGTALVTGALFGLVFGITHIESDGWGAAITWIPLTAFVVLAVAFVLWQRRTTDPILPLSILLDRNRGAAYLSILIAGIGMFGVFLFVTYYMQSTLGYTPIQTGLGFLPMIGMLVIAAQLGTTRLVPRFGPKVLVPIGMVLGAVGMVYLTHLDVHSGYAADVMPPLMVLGAGMGTIIPASMQNATARVDAQFAGVASALVNTSQQVGGSIGTALLNTVAAGAVTAYLEDHTPLTKATAADATLAGYDAAYWWGAGVFLLGAVVAALLFRRRERTGSIAGSTAEQGSVTPSVA